jgi:hypothetical protein
VSPQGGTYFADSAGTRHAIYGLSIRVSDAHQVSEHLPGDAGYGTLDNS